VSCVSPTVCMMVGYYVNNSGSLRPLLLSWHGRTWSLQPLGVWRIKSSWIPELQSVSCVSARACMAVGVAVPPGGDHAGVGFALRWDGRSWSEPNDAALHGRGNVAVSAVSCASAVACTAVGWTNPNDLTGGAVWEWNGSSWSSEPTPDASRTSLIGVSCLSQTRCVAVGWFGSDDSYPVAEIGP
jgi:hypothetical protein